MNRIAHLVDQAGELKPSSLGELHSGKVVDSQDLRGKILVDLENIQRSMKAMDAAELLEQVLVTLGFDEDRMACGRTQEEIRRLILGRWDVAKQVEIGQTGPLLQQICMNVLRHYRQIVFNALADGFTPPGDCRFKDSPKAMRDVMKSMFKAVIWLATHAQGGEVLRKLGQNPDALAGKLVEVLNAPSCKATDCFGLWVFEQVFNFVQTEMKLDISVPLS